MTTSKAALPFRIGIIGCGAISNAYFKNLAPFSKFAKVAACADIDLERAQAKAKEHGVAKAYSVKDLLDDPEIDAVLNLTIPAAHASVNLEAIEAGKHSYCEKPFSLTYQDGRKVLAEADRRKLRLGCAPDTVLGGGIQTCRKLIDDGVIGNADRRERQHAQPRRGDVASESRVLLQDRRRAAFRHGALLPDVAGDDAGADQERLGAGDDDVQGTADHEPAFHGKVIKVETPTHLVGALEFGNGAIGTVTMSFDVWSHRQPMLEIYGTEGSIQCPDPNTFGGEVLVWTTATKEWSKVRLSHTDRLVVAWASPISPRPNFRAGRIA